MLLRWWADLSTRDRVAYSLVGVLLLLASAGWIAGIVTVITRSNDPGTPPVPIVLPTATGTRAPNLSPTAVPSATATLLFRQVFVAIPDELVEAARMDGAGPLRFLKDIVIPVSGANIAALFVILFVYGWNQYLWPLLVATDPKLDTIVIGITRLIGVETQTDWSAVLATAVLALVPPVVVVVVMQRWFVAGLTEGEK